ncbi:MAG: hypothetical protein F6K39_12700 [Okeania sp. SIO3B3]|nr:hypothetical protein [Okeania sp. SIO3B3]
MLIILVFASPCTDALMQRPYRLPYSPAQQNVEKFLINGIIWVAQPRLLRRNIFGELLKIPVTKITSDF